MSANLSPFPFPARTQRHSAYPIDALFLQRWSPRAFVPQGMPLLDLKTILEAARWAPSAHNLQPWHFLYALREDQHWARYLSLLHPFNAGWAKDASALLFLLSRVNIPADNNAPAQPSRTHSFDAGAAWAHLALQAAAMGYQAHAMAGIEFDAAREALKVAPTHRIEIAVAIGRQAEASRLPAALQKREHPSERQPLDQMVTAGEFAHAAASWGAQKGGAA